MGFITSTILLAIYLFLGLLGSVEIGYRKGKRDQANDSDGKIESLGTVDSTVFGLLGLILAFTFTGALTRFDYRRELIVKEANAIGTAYLRLDLLPPNSQAKLRPLYKQYVQARIDIYENVEDKLLTKERYQETLKLQNQIWQIANSSVLIEKNPGIISFVLSSTNDMIDISNDRIQATKIHPPNVVYVFLFVLAIVSGLLIGYNMSANQQRYFYHIVLFCLIISSVIYVILDLEYPRLGLIQIDEHNRVLIEVLESMK